MAINPSSYGYCRPAAGCCGSGNSSGATGQVPPGDNSFIIRRHDTCPPLIVSVKGEGKDWVDLTGWSATGTLFSVGKIIADIGNDAVANTVLSMDKVANIHVGDVIRAESPDGREKMLVTAVDRAFDTVTVDRGYEGTTILPHLMDTEVYAIKATGIPVEIEMMYENEGLDSDFAIVTLPSGTSEGVVQFPSQMQKLTRSVLKVNWRPSDTAQVGAYYLQIELLNEDTTRRLTLPRGVLGFPVRVLVDANDI